MSNVKTVIEEWSVKDLEDGSSINISVLDCTELGNEAKPGVQVCYMGQIINVEPLAVERWSTRRTKRELQPGYWNHIPGWPMMINM